MSSKKQEKPTPEENVPETPEVTETSAAEEAAEAAGAPEAEISEEEKLRQELAGEKDKYLRLAAEYDNFRRRSARERENIYADVRADTIIRLLPVYDNLELALANPTEDEAYRRGVEMILNQFTAALAELGVTPIEAVGKTFDPALHNAVMHVEDPEKGENEIAQEFKKGFRLGDKVIRFSMVQVAN